MVTNFPVADMLIRIKNGYAARKSSVVMPLSKLKNGIADVLVENGFILDKKIIETDGRKELSLGLKYNEKNPVITKIKIVSKPSLRVYVKKDRINKVLGGMGVAIISTPMGIMTDKDAKKKGFGGEVIAEIY